MLPLLSALQQVGLAATATGSHTAALVVSFAHGEIRADLDAFLEIADGRAELDLIVPVLSISLDRLAALPLDRATIDCLFDSENDELHLVAAVTCTEPDVDLVLNRLVEPTRTALRTLLDAGVVDVVDASEDALVASALDALQELKERSPLEAVASARESAIRCRSLGNPSLGSLLDVAAAEVLIELGEIHQAADLVEPAWAQLDAPTYWREVVTVVAQLRARQGELGLAVALLEAAVDQQEDEFDAAVVRGDLGVLLAQSGQRVEASHLLGAAANDEHLDELHRSHFRSQLELLRGQSMDAGLASADSIDVTNARLNELASILLQADTRELARSRDRLEELIADVLIDVPRLGPSQQVRLSMGQACLAVLDGRASVAREHFDRAIEVADMSGDVELARWVRNQSNSLLDPIATSTSEPSSTPMEQLATLLNRAVAELSVSVVKAHTAALDAIELADNERHRYASVADRAAWSALASRVYEVGLASSLAIGDNAEVIEILERARAQGAPASRDGNAELSGSGVSRWEEDGEGELSTHLLRLTRESLGDRPVARPLVASVRSKEQAASGSVLRVDLDEVIAAVAGRSAWWWTCHLFGERLYWALRSPDRKTWAGANVLPGGLREVADLVDSFGSVASREDLRSHPLADDEGGRLDALLTRVAEYLLPQPLADALLDATCREEPFRLIWAAPQALARIPVGILPLGHGQVVLDGAAVVLAPPTSLALATERRSVEASKPRSVVLILGADADLGMLRPFAEAIAPSADVVLGAARHVRTGVAGSLATPQAVREALRSNPDAVVVYYGHVDDDGPFSHSASLSLTDGRGRATLEASEMLTADREGAPHVTVLAGCSSLSASHLGTGEWWGLATALLWQGGRHVVGSTWDLLPTSTTEGFVVELTSALRALDDPVFALRSAQRRLFDSWKRTGQPLPYEWAGWSIVSVGAG